ncbi:RDD family protein [Cytobacillus spongiae]|jgi:uncharacterized RDD family membrane protein YckC|uniref:RDD family protein n=1 Tax=Cytobacillus spongiae TaxID=2901381 RepID=UPI001F1F43AC|nr:RDD family protein [Cytobacillus spongiae]UII57207.1 RDD family protein [Cytobacillus spongiae]
MQTAYEQEGYEGQKYAGFWVRFGAYLIDSIIIGIPLTIITLIIFGVFFGASGTLDMIIADPNLEQEMSDAEVMAVLGSYLGALVVTVLVNLIITVLYYAGLHASKWQGTVGKKLLGLKVMDKNGLKISFWRGLGRYLAMAFLSSIFFIGYIMAGFTDKKQALHDLIAGTVVVKSRS